MARPNRLLAAFAGLWKAVDWTRRLVVNLVFLALLFFLIAFLLSPSTVDIEDGSALLLAPSGDLVEQLWGDPSERLLMELLGQPTRVESLLRDLVDAVERARDDERIAMMVLDLELLAGGGLPKLERLREAVLDFRAAGKRVVAVGEFYFQPQYYLASAADEVVLDPMGGVLLTGYGFSRRYYREALDRIDAEWNVFRVGEYKSAVEPYLRNDMSPEAREAAETWLADLWASFRAPVAASRSRTPEDLDAYVNEFHLKLADHGGDMALLAQAEGLVDRLAARDEVRRSLIEEVGESDGDFRHVDYRSYLAAAGRPPGRGEGTVGVVVAAGTILDGRQPPGIIGGDSTAELIRQARESEEVAAVVLRVDSPGGSAFASEVIRREVELTRQAGKPVVASMGSVAASGGYWIAMSADQIWARPSTLTGSIGIYAMVPTFAGTLGKIGVSGDAVGTGPWAGRVAPELPLPEEVRQSLDLMIQRGYRDFVEKAAAGRRMTYEEVDRIARGRVWSGADALELGLVDRMGDLEEAVAAAAELAGLREGARTRLFEQQPSARARMIERFLSRLPAAPRRAAAGDGSAARWLQRLAGLPEAAALPRGRRGPYALWAHCLCDPRDGGIPLP